MGEVSVPATDWVHDLDLLHEQTALLQGTLARLADSQVDEASMLPGWTRGHVLAHLDGNAQGIGRLVRWAFDGVERPMYISREVRDADVEMHASRDARSHEAAVTQSARTLQQDLRRLTSDQRASQVTLGNGLQVRASSLARHRLQEVCVHHADLGLSDYTWRDWPEAMAAHMARLVARDFAERGEFPVAAIAWDATDGSAGDEISIVPRDTEGGEAVVQGSASAILAWLLGRSMGEGLAITGASQIPAAPAWR